MFIDLVKECNSVRHDVSMLALKKMGAPDQCIKWVTKLHSDFEVVLKIGWEEARIKYGCGVLQGDNLAPTLFAIMIQLAAEDVIRTMKKRIVLTKINIA